MIDFCSYFQRRFKISLTLLFNKFKSRGATIVRYKSRSAMSLQRIKWSGNHFATRNAAESGVISGRIVFFRAALPGGSLMETREFRVRREK